MDRLLNPLILLLSLSFSNLSASSEETVDAFMKESGLAEQLMSFPDQFSEGLNAALSQDQTIEANIKQQLNLLADEVFEPVALNTDIRRKLSEIVSPDSLNDQLKWYRSDLGRKIARLEVNASKPEAFNAVMSSMGSLLQDELWLGKVQQFDALVLGLDNSTKTAATMQKAILSAAFTASGKAEMVPKIVENVDNNKSQLKEQISSLIFASYIYTYQSLSPQEFDQYLSFLGNEGSQYVIKVVNETVFSVLEEKFEIYSKRMVDIIFAEAESGPQSGRLDAPGPPM